MHMDVATQQGRIDAVAWYHEFDFGQGLKSRSAMPEVALHRPIWSFIETQLDSIDFRGKSVLDIGCWDGYWSFYAERRGASQVLATDDGSQNWSDGRGLLLARELYGSRVEIKQDLSVYDLQSLGRKFDIILMLGVYYHLLDPIYALAQVRHCCHAGSVVLIEGNEGLALPPKGAVLDLEQKGSKFLPSYSALQELLQAAYFRVTSRQSLGPPTAGRPRWGWRLRVCAQALLGSPNGVAELLGPMTATGRVFVSCVPVTGRNDGHFYRPPFGLHVYDDRFGEAPSPSA
jgi:tRNA (mo5U34)-methyltransferase